MAKQQHAWDMVFDQINVYSSPDLSRISTPTDSELDLVETRLGSPLPASYRAFMKRFGPGELECALRLTPVTVTNRTGFTLLEETAGQRAYFSKNYPQKAEWLGRVVYFGCNAGGDPYVWDPNELVTIGNGECPVYWLPRHDEDDPQRQADSFFNFVCVELERARKIREEDPQEDGIPINAFEPCYL